MHRQGGFSLLEMVLVVGIMATLGGVVMVTYGGGGKGSVRSSAQEAAVVFEMEQLRVSLQRYRGDGNPFPPLQSSPADTLFLFDKGGLNSWSRDYQLGWRGPYVTGGDSGLVDIGNLLQSTGEGEAYTMNVDIAVSPNNLQRGIPDPFIRTPVDINTEKSAEPCKEISDNNKCLFDWRYLGQAETEEPRRKLGRPYLLFDLGDRKGRIVSMGHDGVYAGNNIGDKCSPKAGSDDIVLCLN